MKNMKKTLALLLAVVLVLGMFPMGAMAEETTEELVVEQAEELLVEEPAVVEEPVVEEPVVEEPVVEEPVVEEPVVEEPVVEEPVVEEPVVEEPVVEEPVVEETAASVDQTALYENILACNTLAEVDTLLESMTEEQMLAFKNSLTQEQTVALAAHLDALTGESDAENQGGQSFAEEAVQEHVSEIVFPTKDMTNVAPFLAPVEGPAERMKFALRSTSGSEEEGNGLILDKDVAGPDKDGVYTLTMEAFATGEKTIITQEEEIPTDIILVLDQSGSMADSFTSVTYSEYSDTLENMYSNRNNLYVKLENGAYSRVTVNRTSLGTGEYTYSLYTTSNSNYYRNTGKFYHQCADGTYGLVTVTRVNNGWFLAPDYVYTYTCANGCTLGTSSNSDVPSFRDSFYQRTEVTNVQYTFTYTKSDGTNETAVVMENGSAPDWDFYLSQAGGSTTRLAALKTAVTNFTNSVAAKAKGADGIYETEDDVDHTISVVGFAHCSSTGSYNNTEIFIGRTGYRYGTSAQGVYDDAPQSMSTAAGVSNVLASVNALDASGSTYIDCGIDLANGILNANPVPSGNKRNRVVVIFTDGAPGYNGSYSGNRYGNSGDAQAAADEALEKIAVTKNTHNATVYTVGIFTGADATSAGSLASNASAAQRANYFMQRLSSNTSYPQTPSYYLSASDSNALNNIFQTISENIESGGSSITLDENAVVKDILTEQFELPEGADINDIKVYTAECTGDGEFANPEVFIDAEVTISSDGKSVSVSNFDFAENWVGSETAADGTVTYRGKKLIIQIPIVPRDGFLGGNGVITNAEGSGVYENADATEPLETFDSPTVDVEIKDVTVSANDYNVYLLADLTAQQLEQGLAVSSGTVVLDMTAENYGLQSWQYAYVTINDDNAFTALEDIVEDTTYSASVTIAPIYTGDAIKKSGNATGNIYVFKPEITWEDSQINLGETAVYKSEAESDTDNFVSLVWKHGNAEADPEKMTGTEPALTYEYTPGADAFIAETPVQVRVFIEKKYDTNTNKYDITDHVSFFREACDFNGCEHTVRKEVIAKDMESWTNFVVHINTFKLTIEKKGADTEIDPGVTFLFNVTCPDQSVFQVMIAGNGSQTITGLPVGEYTVTEDESWSWRYDAKVNPQTVTAANVKNGVVTVTFENTRDTDKWLDGYTSVVNLFNKLSAAE